MDIDRKILRLGTAVIICAVLLRLVGNTLPGQLVRAIGQEDVIRAILFLQTGRVVRQPDVERISTEPVETVTAETVFRETVSPLLTFTAADANLVAVSNLAGYEVDVQAMLQQDVEWKLRSEEPTVLILHTHGTESYRNTEGYAESSEYRTEDENYNMISVGARLAACLEAGGIRVIHDRTPYDLPSYNGSYAQARTAVERHLTENPSICLVLDIHRDAMTDSEGRQVAHTQQIPEGTAAKLMLVSGSDAGGLSYPSWQQNLSLAVKLQAVLERENPGICRPVSFRTGRYNQDLFPNMLLVEVGAAGNTRQEALLAAEQLATAVLQMAEGTIYE